MILLCIQGPDKNRLVSIAEEQYKESILIEQRLHRFNDKISALIEPTGITLTEAQETRSQSEAATNPNNCEQTVASTSTYGKLNSSIPGCPDILSWNCNPSHLSTWF